MMCCHELRDEEAKAMRSTIPIAALALAVLPWTLEAAQFRSVQQNQMRFREMDRNNDGIITRAEWTGTAATFRLNDWNGDGVLSGEEVRIGASRTNRINDQNGFRAWDEAAFSSLDSNRNGRIDASEWFYATNLFVQADRNRD